MHHVQAAGRPGVHIRSESLQVGARSDSAASLALLPEGRPPGELSRGGLGQPRLSTGSEVEYGLDDTEPGRPVGGLPAV